MRIRARTLHCRAACVYQCETHVRRKRRRYRAEHARGKRSTRQCSFMLDVYCTCAHERAGQHRRVVEINAVFRVRACARASEFRSRTRIDRHVCRPQSICVRAAPHYFAGALGTVPTSDAKLKRSIAVADAPPHEDTEDPRARNEIPPPVGTNRSIYPRPDAN